MKFNIFGGERVTTSSNDFEVDKEKRKAFLEDRIRELQGKDDFGQDEKEEVEHLVKELGML